MNNTIPKIVHYCWFGKGKKSDFMCNCIDGWKKKLVDYKFIEWNEDNFDININTYVKEAYKNKKYAFVSDFVRLYALENYGGIYLDTDVEVLDTFDMFLNLNAFVGFEDFELVSTAVIGAKKGNKLIHKWIKTYDDKVFLKDGKMNTETNVRYLTNLLLDYGLKQNNTQQNIYNDNITIFPIDYFSPLKIGRKKPNITHNTKCIHWFDGSWLTINQRIKLLFITYIKELIGFKKYNKIKAFIK